MVAHLEDMFSCDEVGFRQNETQTSLLNNNRLARKLSVHVASLDKLHRLYDVVGTGIYV